MTDLAIDVRRADGRVVVSFSGELDMSEVGRVRQELDALAAPVPGTIVLDLRNLSFIDSSGLRVIIEADLRARREARDVLIVPGPDPVHRIFLIALLDRRLTFVDPADAGLDQEEP